jgi:hypothetical protein
MLLYFILLFVSFPILKDSKKWRVLLSPNVEILYNPKDASVESIRNVKVENVLKEFVNNLHKAFEYS